MALASVFAKPNLRYLRITFQPSRHFKSALKIKWVRPEKIPSIKPEVSGDLEPLGTIDMQQPPTPYNASAELQSANDIVKRIYSLEFFNRQTIKDEYFIQYINRVKAHKLDDDSPEVKIARMTAKIRNLQIHVDKYPRDIVNKVRLKESIDKREKHLRSMRKTDYKKFEWILDKLNVIYKAYGFQGHERVERKRSLRRLTALYIGKLKSERLAEYRQFLEAQQVGFLQEKLEKLIWMKKTEEEYGVEPTVTETDIESVRKHLQELQLVRPKAVTAE